MQSLDRLLRILEAVSGNSQPSSVTEVTEQVGLSISTVSRLMRVLADADLLHQSEVDRRYTLGPRLFALAHAAEQNLDLTALVRPVLTRLRDITGETASFHVMRGSQRVCLVEVPSRHEVRRVVPVGLTHDLDGGATAAVLLSGLSPERTRELLAGFKTRGADLNSLNKHIEHARTHGWVHVADEWVKDLASVSAAVWRADSVFGAISVSGPQSRFSDEVALSHVPAISAAAAEVSARIGGAPPVSA